MYFCPNCSYLFDIVKSTNVNIQIDDTRTNIKKFIDALKLVEENADLNLYKAEFLKDEMIKNKKYNKLSDSIKIKLNTLFEDNTSSINAEFKCNNCSNTKKINETTLLYKITSDDIINNNKTLEENELTTKDPILPRTHDYICKNSDCVTHKNSSIKEAVFYKNKNCYKLNYICCVCYYNW
jgi:hypothetical protein